MTSHHFFPASAAQALARILGVLLLAGALGWATPGARAAGKGTKRFDIPRGDAAVTLKQFAAQSGVQLLYTMEAVRGVISQPVAGHMTARDALARMFAGTALTVVQDRGNGALSLVAAPSKRPKTEAGAKRPPRAES